MTTKRKRKPEQVPFKSNLLKLDPLTGRMVCRRCFNGDHHRCEVGTECECLHRNTVKRVRKVKVETEQIDMGGFGTIIV